MFIITKQDGSTELFRDNPVRYLVVEPDPQTGELRPTAKWAGWCISTSAANSESPETRLSSDKRAELFTHRQPSFHRKGARYELSGWVVARVTAPF